MLHLVYNPEGGTSQEFQFDPNSPLNLEAEALEAVGDEAWQDYAAWMFRIGSGNIRARRALLWVMLRRSNPTLRFVDVVFNVGEFLIEDTEDQPAPVGKDEPDESDTDSPSLPPGSEQSPSNSAGT